MKKCRQHSQQTPKMKFVVTPSFLTCCDMNKKSSTAHLDRGADLSKRIGRAGDRNPDLPQISTEEMQTDALPLSHTPQKSRSKKDGLVRLLANIVQCKTKQYHFTSPLSSDRSARQGLEVHSLQEKGFHV